MDSDGESWDPVGYTELDALEEQRYDVRPFEAGEEEHDLLFNVLFRDEQVKWIRHVPFSQTMTASRILFIIWPLVLSILFFVASPIIFHFVRDWILMFGLALVGLIFGFFGVWIWDNFYGEYYYILTNTRVISCFHQKRKYHLQTTSMPYKSVRLLQRSGSHSISFKGYEKQFKVSKHENKIKFEFLEDPDHVFSIANGLLREATTNFPSELRLTDSGHLSLVEERAMYYVSLRTYLLYPNTHFTWPNSYQQILENLSESDTDEPERVLWSLIPTLWQLRKSLGTVAFAVISPISLLLTYISIVERNFTILAVGVPGLALCFWGMLFMFNQYRAAYALTTKGLIIIQTGMKPRTAVESKGWWNHGSKVRYRDVYPLTSVFNLRSGIGKIQLHLDPQLTIYGIPDLKLFEEILYKSNLLSS